MRLAEAVECHAIAVEPLKVEDCRRHAVSAEAVERPDEHHVKLAPRRVDEQLGITRPLISAFTAAFVLDVLAGDCMAHAREAAPAGTPGSALCHWWRPGRRWRPAAIRSPGPKPVDS